MAGNNAGAEAKKEKVSCELEFEAAAGRRHGTIMAGDIIRGTLTFTAVRDKQVGDTQFYKAKGLLKVSREGHGMLVGEVWDIHVTRSKAVADLVAIDIRNLIGDLGKQKQYIAPTLVTLYGKRGQLSDFDLPMTPTAWNAFQVKRVFQFHSPTAMNVALNTVGPFTGRCS